MSCFAECILHFGLTGIILIHCLPHFDHTSRHNSLVKDMLGPMPVDRQETTGWSEKQWLDDLKVWSVYSRTRGTYRKFAHVTHAR